MPLEKRLHLRVELCAAVLRCNGCRGDGGSGRQRKNCSYGVPHQLAPSEAAYRPAAVTEIPRLIECIRCAGQFLHPVQRSSAEVVKFLWRLGGGHDERAAAADLLRSVYFVTRQTGQPFNGGPRRMGSHARFHTLYDALQTAIESTLRAPWRRNLAQGRRTSGGRGESDCLADRKTNYGGMPGETRTSFAASGMSMMKTQP